MSSSVPLSGGASYGVNPYKSDWRSPLGDLFAYFGNTQFTHRCRELELNVLDCTDVFGRKGLTKQCLEAYDDFCECVYEYKTRARVEAMRKERMRQYLVGERSKANLWNEPPKLDGYWKTYGKSVD